MTPVASLPSARADHENSRENARLAEVQRLEILDTPRDEAFDRIVRLVKDLLRVPMAAITIFDAHRGWVKAQEGWAHGECIDRKQTFCTHTIQSDAPLIVADAAIDKRFAANPFVIGKPHIRSYAGVPLRTDKDENIGALCVADLVPRQFSSDQVRILTSFAEVAVQELELRLQLATDPLTGLLSRRSFETEGLRAVALSRRHGQSLAAVCFDLDNFKTINDRFGHAKGDQVLARVANVVRAFLRETDTISRLGGEEFAILLPRTDGKDARIVANKLRKAIEHLQFEGAPTAFNVTASFGVASLPKEIKQLDQLLANADAALYQAKNGGKNRCVLWDDGENLTAPRRVLKAGKILFNRRMSTMDCTVRSISDTQATMDVLNASEVPKRFDLVIRADNFEKPCRVLSHTDRYLEVEFC